MVDEMSSHPFRRRHIKTANYLAGRRSDFWIEIEDFDKFCQQLCVSGHVVVGEIQNLSQSNLGSAVACIVNSLATFHYRLELNVLGAVTVKDLLSIVGRIVVCDDDLIPITGIILGKETIQRDQQALRSIVGRDDDGNIWWNLHLLLLQDRTDTVCNVHDSAPGLS